MRYLRHWHTMRRVAHKMAPPKRWRSSSGTSAWSTPIEYYEPNPGEVWQVLLSDEVETWSPKHPERDAAPGYLPKGTTVTVLKRKKKNKYGDRYLLVLVDGTLRSMLDDSFNSEDTVRVL